MWSWGSVRAPLLAVQDGTNVRCGALHMGSNVEEKGTLLVESGSLTVGGEFWLQNAALTVTARPRTNTVRSRSERTSTCPTRGRR